MTWQEIYNKHKDSTLMKEFYKYWDKRGSDYHTLGWSGYEGNFTDANIIELWGVLICFAETKGWIINILTKYERYERRESCIIYNIVNGQDYGDIADSSEQAMLWCATKFFEINEVENETK